LRARPWTFIASQRIIAALADAIVVVEAGQSSGLLVAQIATGLGAEVAVVPGRLTDPGGKWLFRLLQDGAHPVSCAQDVVDLFGGRTPRRPQSVITGTVGVRELIKR
jgi:DNA processing protein